jgi:CRISPR/Cas system CSM-associated protein Csm4 (group 5 of RAMP superfamily)
VYLTNRHSERTELQSIVKPQVRYSSSLYADTRDALQPKPLTKATVPNHANNDAAGSGQKPADSTEAGPVSFSGDG